MSAWEFIIVYFCVYLKIFIIKNILKFMQHFKLMFHSKIPSSLQRRSHQWFYCLRREEVDGQRQR